MLGLTSSVIYHSRGSVIYLIKHLSCKVFTFDFCIVKRVGLRGSRSKTHKLMSKSFFIMMSELLLSK